MLIDTAAGRLAAPRPCQALSSFRALTAAGSSARNVPRRSPGLGRAAPNPRTLPHYSSSYFSFPALPSPWLSTDFCDHPFRPSLPLARKLSRDLDLHCVIHRCHLGPQPGAWLPAQCVFVDVGGQETRLKAGRGAESCGNRKSRPRAPVPSLALLGKRSQAPRASVSLVCEMGG